MDGADTQLDSIKRQHGEIKADAELANSYNGEHSLSVARSNG
jgi:hypothetical protein